MITIYKLEVLDKSNNFVVEQKFFTAENLAIKALSLTKDTIKNNSLPISNLKIDLDTNKEFRYYFGKVPIWISIKEINVINNESEFVK